jgi:hypothetical protein
MSRAGRVSRAHLRRLAVVTLAIAGSAAIAACGGSSHPKAAVRLTPTQLVSQSFSSSDAVNSGRISVTLTATLKGLKALGGKPVTVDVSGPFSRGAGNQLEADFTVAAQIGSSNVSLGLDRFDGTSYLGVEGTFYKLPSSGKVLGLTIPGAGASGASGATGLFDQLGVNPRNWLTDPHEVGTTSVGGVTTDHLSAALDIAAIVGDLTRVVGGSTGASGASSSLGNLSTLIQSAINSATVDIYTGTADHIVRRFDLAISFSVPQIAAGALGNLSGGSLDLDATLTGVNEPQTVTAPANAQPASGLLNGLFAIESRLGKIGSLFSGIAAGGSFGGLLGSGSTSG